MLLIAAAGEHALCGHEWPILRKRGRGCAVATLGFTFAEESKLLLTPRGRSSAHAKSTGRDLPTDFAVGRTHNRCSILRDRDTGDGWPRTSHESPCPEANAAHLHRVRLATRVAGRRFRDETGVGPQAVRLRRLLGKRLADEEKARHYLHFRRLRGRCLTGCNDGSSAQLTRGRR